MGLRVGIVGISGFGGGEALRLLAGHPAFELVYAAGGSSAGARLGERFPGVPARLAGLAIERWDPESLPELDLLFASLPATPDWKPIPGPIGLDGPWLDIGHGGLGFAIGCGTGELLAAMTAGRATAIPVEPYPVGRDGRRGAEAPTAG